MNYEEILDIFEVKLSDFNWAVSVIDQEFAVGNITQKEWAKLYQIVCEWDVQCVVTKDDSNGN